MTSDKRRRMIFLVSTLNSASKKYYSGEEESDLSDKEYDKLMRELIALEVETGEYISGTPTKRVGFEAPRAKQTHILPILSLKDTKDIGELLRFLGDKEGVMSWKLDGVSLVLYYQDGALVKAMTRGDGAIGSVVNVRDIQNVPSQIPVKGKLVVRGEGCISLHDFELIKQTEKGERYSNPRNLAAGIVNTSKIPNTFLRYVTFIAHSLVYSDGDARSLTTRSSQLAYLGYFGFKVVPYTKVLNFELKKQIECYTKKVDSFTYPVDGLVLTINDIHYGDSLGSTVRFPRHSMAFKWPDEYSLAKVTGMKWSVSVTGLITPVVIFEPVELEGTTVHQANLHTLKRFLDLEIGIGDTLKIYKANKIIPEIEDNLTRSKTEEYPRYCPTCGEKTVVIKTTKTQKLYCRNCGGIASQKLHGL